MLTKTYGLRPCAVTLAVALALGLSGCGGGSNVRATTVAPPSGNNNGTTPPTDGNTPPSTGTGSGTATGTPIVVTGTKIVAVGEKLASPIELAPMATLDNAGTVGGNVDTAVKALGTADSGWSTIVNHDGGVISASGTAAFMEFGGVVTNEAGATIETTGGPAENCTHAGGCAILVGTSAMDGAPDYNRLFDLTNAGTIVGSVQMNSEAFFPPTAVGNQVTLVAGGTIKGDLDFGADPAAYPSLTLTGAAGQTQLYSKAVTGTTAYPGHTLAVNGQAKWILDTDAFKDTPRILITDGATLQIGNGGTVGAIGTDKANWALDSIDVRNGTLVFDLSSDLTVWIGIGWSVDDPSYVHKFVQAGTGTLTLARGAAAEATVEQGSTLRLLGGGLSDVTLDGSLVFDGIGDGNQGTGGPIGVDGVISGSGSVTKFGSGIVELFGANTYTGGTTITNGILAAAAILPGDVTVGANATLCHAPPGPGASAGCWGGFPGVAGNLANAGKVIVNEGLIHGVGGNYVQASTGALTLAYAGVNVANGGTWTVGGNFTAAGGSTIALAGSESIMPDLRGYPRHDRNISVEGNLTLGGVTLSTPAGDNMLTPGIQNIFTYGGTLNEANGGIALAEDSSHGTLQIQILPGTKQINLVNSANHPMAFWNGDSAASSARMGGGNGTWSATSKVWTDATGTVTDSVMPYSGFAIFAGTPGIVTVDSTAAGVGVSGLQFAVDGYTLTGGSLKMLGTPAGSLISPLAPQGENLQAMIAPIVRVGDGSSSSFDMTVTISAVLTGMDGLAKTGPGTLVLTAANTYTGQTIVSDGVLQSAGALNGDVRVLTNGTLDGVPSVAGYLSNEGRVTVHDGDVNVSGYYTGTGTLAVSLGSKLVVTGTAILWGGTLEVTGADQGYVANTHTSVLTATGGVNGVFDDLIKDKGVVFTSTTINYGANEVWLDTTGLDITTAAAGNGVTYTPASMGSAERVQGAFEQLDSKIASGSISSVSDAFVQNAGAFQQSPNYRAAQASLESLSGQLHAASAGMTLQAIDATGRALSDRLEHLSLQGNKPQMWMSQLQQGGNMTRSGFANVDYQLNGWMVGRDMRVGAHTLAGFAFSQGQGTEQLSGRFDRNRSRNAAGMFYLGWLGQRWYAHGRVGMGHYHQNMNRRLLLGTTYQGVWTDYDGHYNVAYGESGLHFGVGSMRLTPFVDLEYDRVARSGFAEQGAGGFGLKADDQTLSRWQGGLGLKLARQWQFSGGRSISLDARAQWRQTLSANGTVFNASFVGLNEWQPLTGVGLSRHSTAFGLDLKARPSANTRFQLGYEYLTGDHGRAGVASANFSLAF